jgi:hypothetical protein
MLFLQVKGLGFVEVYYWEEGADSWTSASVAGAVVLTKHDKTNAIFLQFKDPEVHISTIIIMSTITHSSSSSSITITHEHLSFGHSSSSSITITLHSELHLLTLIMMLLIQCLESRDTVSGEIGSLM